MSFIFENCLIFLAVLSFVKCLSISHLAIHKSTQYWLIDLYLFECNRMRAVLVIQHSGESDHVHALTISSSATHCENWLQPVQTCSNPVVKGNHFSLHGRATVFVTQGLVLLKHRGNKSCCKGIPYVTSKRPQLMQADRFSSALVVQHVYFIALHKDQ